MTAQKSFKALVRARMDKTGSYERARGLRAVGEHTDGFAISASRTGW